MKKVVLNILKRKAPRYYKIWSTGVTFESPIKHVGHSGDWEHFVWAGLHIYLNIQTGALSLLCDDKRWEGSL